MDAPTIIACLLSSVVGILYVLYRRAIASADEQQRTCVENCLRIIDSIEEHYQSSAYVRDKVAKAAWCALNTGDWSFTENGFEFANDDDALLFKLKWEGAK